MMSRLCRTLLGVLLLLAATAAPASDSFSFAGEVNVDTPVNGDKVAFGGTININAEISGDLAVTGGQVHITRAIGKGLLAAGGEVSLAAPVGGDARIFAGTAEITEGAKVEGNARFNGKEVNVRGPIAGRLEVRGEQVLIDSTIGGNVVARADHLELGPNARIMGSLRYAGNTELVRDPAAEVHGSVEHNALDARWQRWVNTHSDDGDEEDERDWSWTWTGRDFLGGARPWMPSQTYGGGMALFIAFLIAAIAPVYAQRLGAVVDTQLGSAMLLGLVTLIGVPILSVILMITLIGIPVAVVLLIAYALLIAVAQAISGVAFGEVALHRLAPERSHESMVRVLFVVVAMLGLLALGRMPLLGGWVTFLALLTGMGAVLKVMRRSPAPPAPAY